ncbi:hypothetical protein [Celeribacter indicus]|uniref:Uncharacterized protein n=1 Tax=Celeribacter indicus TaxID=1208324 RepID=A0A0B5DW13_9RHOB|nr:hypothetical protein [Celeribacter indicus]AJE47174.1 hypothetical protein P73_2459 [Celeribacter indicus]SDW00100.1 hypothetical protein SAMN05443573_1019 [Celeribacter indicus]
MSDFPEHHFRELKMNTPLFNITVALSIIQSHILASDSALDPHMMWGGNHIKDDGLEAAVALLAPVIDVLEDLSWEGEK